jgi:G3E family GTPase
MVRNINPQAELLRCTNSVVPVQKLFGLNAFDLESYKKTGLFAPEMICRPCVGLDVLTGRFRSNVGLDMLTGRFRSNHISNQVMTVSLQYCGDIDYEKLLSWIEHLVETQSDKVLRMKGLIPTYDPWAGAVGVGSVAVGAGSGKRKLLAYQSVQTSVQGDFIRDLGAGEEVVAQLVFIGRGLDRAQLEEDFLACRLDADQSLASNNEVANNEHLIMIQGTRNDSAQSSTEGYANADAISQGAPPGLV